MSGQHFLCGQIPGYITRASELGNTVSGAEASLQSWSLGLESAPALVAKRGHGNTPCATVAKHGHDTMRHIGHPDVMSSFMAEPVAQPASPMGCHIGDPDVMSSFVAEPVARPVSPMGRYHRRRNILGPLLLTRIFQSTHPTTLLQAAVQDLLASELLQPAPNIWLFLVAKPDGSVRLTLDLSPWTGFC
jgi:hypothetical protein